MNRNKIFRTAILTIIAAMTMCVTFTSCGPKDIQSVVEGINKKCPLKGDGFQVQEVTYENNTVTFSYLFDENKVPVKMLANMTEQLKPALLKTFTSGDMADIITMCLQENAGINIIIRGDKSEEEATLTFTPEELKATMPQ